MPNEFPVLKLEGTREEMGAAHGEHFRELIVGLIQSRTDILYSEFPALTIGRLEEVCSSSIEVTQKYTPSIFREVKATARACNVPAWKLIVCGGYTDLLDVFRMQFKLTNSDDISECTTLINPADGVVLGTWDSNPEALDCAVVLQREPIDISISSVCLTTAGWPAQQGINSSGIAFAINNLMPAQADEFGLNYISANAMLAEVESISQFIAFARGVDF